MREEPTHHAAGGKPQSITIIQIKNWYQGFFHLLVSAKYTGITEKFVHRVHTIVFNNEAHYNYQGLHR